MISGIVAWQMTASQTEKRSEMSWEVGGGAQDRRWHTCGVLLLHGRLSGRHVWAQEYAKEEIKVLIRLAW